MYETLVIETRGPVATVWLNRPEVHNAFNAKVIEELTAAFTRGITSVASGTVCAFCFTSSAPSS